MPEREKKRVPDDSSYVLKESLPQGALSHPRISEYLRLGEESEMESRDEATQRTMEELYWRQCGNR